MIYSRAKHNFYPHHGSYTTRDEFITDKHVCMYIHRLYRYQKENILYT